MPYKLTVASSLPAGVQYLELPSDPGNPPLQLSAGESTTVDDETYAQIDPNLFTDNLLTATFINESGSTVTTQGPAVTLTSSQLGTPTGTESTDVQTLFTAYNKLQTDVAALNTALSGTGRALV